MNPQQSKFLRRVGRLNHGVILVEKSILIVLASTLLLFTIATSLQILDQKYHREHLEELTSTEVINGSTYYNYADTPYTTLAGIFSIIYFLLAPLVVLIVSGRFLSREKEKTAYLQSLLIPLSFLGLTLVLQAFVVYYSEGSFRTDLAVIQLGIMFLYALVVFLLVSLINGLIIYLKKKRRS